MPRETLQTRKVPPKPAALPHERHGWIVEENHSAERALLRKEKRVGRALVKFALVAVILAGVGAALVTRNWVLFGIALLVFIPFLFIIMAPLWLARTTQVAQKTEGRADAEEEGPLTPP